jgi:hypothetical protein
MREKVRLRGNANAQLPTDRQIGQHHLPKQQHRTLSPYSFSTREKIKCILSLSKDAAKRRS